MSKFLSEVKGFTPVIDILAQELGLMAAVVYGIVWRYCQMEDHVCTASLDRIAEHANISRRTVERHVRDLCDAGYLEDRTPGKRHRPHIYANTGRAKITGLLMVEIGTTESRTPDQSTTESPESTTESRTTTTESRTEYDRKSHKETLYDSIHEREEERKPDLFDLAQKTIDAREKAGGNYATPDNDELVDTAITSLCGGNAPRKGSGTWRDMTNTIKPIHADWGLHDEEIGEALTIIRAAISLFLEEKQQMAVYKYPSFAANYGQYLSRAMNGDTGEASRRPRDDPDKFDRARTMTLEWLAQREEREAQDGNR